MRLLKPVRVSVFESQVPTLLFARSLLLEILLSIMFKSASVGNFVPAGGSSLAFSPIA